MNVKPTMTRRQRATRENAAHSQSDAFVEMCTAASGGLESRASFRRTNISGTNMAEGGRGRKRNRREVC